MMIKKDRILKEFEELISIDSLSFEERDMADRLKEKLTALGFEVCEDNAGAQEDGTAGNVYGYLKGTLPGDPILFSAHMDTGGEGTNIIPELCTCEGEIRSYSHEKALALMDQLTRTFEKAAEEVGAAVEVTPDIRLIAYDIPKDAPVVTHFKEACEKLGLAGNLTETFGGSDNNNFVLHGIQGIVLSSGMYEAHSVKEYTYVQDLLKGAELVAALVEQL